MHEGTNVKYPKHQLISNFYITYTSTDSFSILPTSLSSLTPISKGRSTTSPPESRASGIASRNPCNSLFAFRMWDPAHEVATSAIACPSEWEIQLIRSQPRPSHACGRWSDNTLLSPVRTHNESSPSPAGDPSWLAARPPGLTRRSLP